MSYSIKSDAICGSNTRSTSLWRYWNCIKRRRISFLFFASASLSTTMGSHATDIFERLVFLFAMLLPMMPAYKPYMYNSCIKTVVNNSVVPFTAVQIHPIEFCQHVSQIKTSMCLLYRATTSGLSTSMYPLLALLQCLQVPMGSIPLYVK